jgi:SAM-dependent methyltransferase
MAANERDIWTVGYGSLICDDFYRLMPVGSDTTGRMLDAGCGHGPHVKNWKQIAPKLSMYGLDLSASSIRRAVDHDRSDVKFAVASIEAMPFPTAAFDYVVSHEVVEHVETPERALADVFRVLRPGGLAAIATPNGASLWVEHLRQRVTRARGRRGAPVGADHTRPPGFWRRELRRVGFTIEKEIYDGIAIDFLTYMAPATVMHAFARFLEPIRCIPGLRYLLADRVKFLVRKPP